MTLKWKLKWKFWRIYTHILGLIRGEEKLSHELNYWIANKEKEGNFSNTHYKYFYIDHFGFNDSFYIGKKILDIGCGPRGSLEWADMCSERIGLDPLVESYRTLGIDKHKMRYVRGNTEDIQFEDGYFDVVSSFNSLDHVDNLDQTISEIKRVIAPGGSLLLLTELGHDATPTEPVIFSWDIVARFAKDFKIVDERHFEKCENGMYESIMRNITYDHLNPKKRYGILSLHAINESK